VAAQKKLDELLADVKEAKKHRLTAQRAHELLLGAGVQVGYTLVKELMARRRLAAKAVSVPLEFAPGEVAEVDFFIRGVSTTRTVRWSGAFPRVAEVRTLTNETRCGSATEGADDDGHCQALVNTDRACSQTLTLDSQAWSWSESELQR